MTVQDHMPYGTTEMFSVDGRMVHTSPQDHEVMESSKSQLTSILYIAI